MEGLKLDEKSTFKMPRLLFSSKLDWGSSIQFTAKIFSKKTGILICYIVFSSGVALFLSSYHPALHGILLPCLGWCPKLLLAYGG